MNIRWIKALKFSEIRFARWRQSVRTVPLEEDPIFGVAKGRIVGAGTIIEGIIPPGTLAYAETKDRLRMVPRR